MRLRFITGLLLAIALIGTQVISAATDQPLNNADVVKMVQSHIDNDTIVEMIKTHKNVFDTSPNAVVALKKSGVPDAVIYAMVTTSTASTASTATTATTATMMKMPAVEFIDGSTKTPLHLSTTQMVQNQQQGGGYNAGSGMLQGLASEGLSMLGGPIGGMVGGLFGMFAGQPKVAMPHMHVVWAVPNPASSNVITTATPAFDVSYSDIPGIDPDAFAPSLIKLIPTKDNWRLVGASDQELDPENFGSAPQPKNVIEEKVASHVDSYGGGHARVTSQAPLASGEYALVLRPLNRAGAPSAIGGPARNQLFYTVWDFSVRPASPSASQSG